MFLVLPNHLFENVDPILHSGETEVCIIEEPIYFYDKKRPFNFNKIKLGYMVACMSYYYDYLRSKCQSLTIRYIPYDEARKMKLCQRIVMYDPCDTLVYEKYKHAKILDHPNFLMMPSNMKEFVEKTPQKALHSTYWKFVQQKTDILVGSKSTDKQNRHSLPKTFKIDEKRAYATKETKKYYEYAAQYINTHNTFKNNIGSMDELTMWPITFADSKQTLMVFLSERFSNFGNYQDAIHTEYVFLHHATISPMLNIGLLDVQFVVEHVLRLHNERNVAFNNVEGFLRQLAGWREYEIFLFKNHYDVITKSNTFNNHRCLKWEYWYGKQETGILVLDVEIRKALRHGYSHHIIRLMVFLNMFVLLGVRFEDIYRWFMEVVNLDAWDWVMVSNIGSMGYFTDKFMQKPYLSTSNYILKMSNYKKGDWCEVWDALFYTFLYENKDKLKGGAAVYKRNLKYFEGKSNNEKQRIITVAHNFRNKVTSEVQP